MLRVACFVLAPLFVYGLQVLIERLIFPQRCIKSVFDVIIDTSRHELLDLDPLVAVLLVQLHQLNVLGYCPLIFV